MGSLSPPPSIAGQEYPAWIKYWFALDAILALLPPIYWAASGPSPSVLGLPLSVFYFILTGASITGSVVAAYAVEVKRGNFNGIGTHHVLESEQ